MPELFGDLLLLVLIPSFWKLHWWLSFKLADSFYYTGYWGTLGTVLVLLAIVILLVILLFLLFRLCFEVVPLLLAIHFHR